MKNRLRASVMMTVILAAMLAATCAAFADYGFGPSTNSGHGFGQSDNGGQRAPSRDTVPGNGSGGSSGSQASPLTVSFHGSIDFVDGATGNWSASASGGKAPYRYQWNLEGAGTISSCQTAQRSFQTGGRGGRATLTVTVWDADGQRDSVSRLVVVKARNGQYPSSGQHGL
ncbi:MAG: PKD domain-containing protein [Candidatus Eremiobacteraeota bacterium]|nr:PKD domain-containing protein [Candidatus Eremiobacteraeota bacterium]